jgi:toluene monooxygenase system ferredoxin subunit
MAFVPVCKTDAVHEGGIAWLRVGKKSVLLVWPTAGELRAYRGRCPHQDVTLDAATFDGTQVLCTVHNWHFDGRTGSCVTPRSCALTPFPVRIEGDEIHVDLGSQKPERTLSASQ